MENNLFFDAGYNRIIVQPLEVKPDTVGGIFAPDGTDVKTMLARFSSHPKQARVVAIGTLDERYEGTIKVGDQVILRLATMVEPLIIKGSFYGSIAPSDIMGKTKYHKDLKLEIDKDFYNKIR